MVAKTLLFFSLVLYCLTGNSQAPNNFKGKVDFEELSRSIEELKEDTVLINFWATWCKPCVEELPLIERFSKDHPDVRVVLVSLDFEGQEERELFPFIRDRNLKHDIYLLADPKTNIWIPKVDKNWSGAIPATLSISAGERFFHEGVFNKEEEIFDFIKNGKL